jgi:hypothetical protein
MSAPANALANSLRIAKGALSLAQLLPLCRSPGESEPSLIQDTMSYGAAGAGVGACIGALESAWMINPGPTPFRTSLTLMGGHAAMFGSIAAVFAATEARCIPQTSTPAGA